MLGVERPPCAHPLLVRKQRARRRRAQLEQYERDVLLLCAVEPGATGSRRAILRWPVGRLPLLHPRTRRTRAAALHSHQGRACGRRRRDVRAASHHPLSATTRRCRGGRRARVARSSGVTFSLSSRKPRQAGAPIIDRRTSNKLVVLRTRSEVVPECVCVYLHSVIQSELLALFALFALESRQLPMQSTARKNMIPRTVKTINMST